MMKFKKTMLLVFVLILVVGLTGCDNWQTGIDEVENATGPSWDLDLAIPLLPETTVDVGERLAEELGDGENENIDTEELKVNLYDETIVNQSINIVENLGSGTIDLGFDKINFNFSDKSFKFAFESTDLDENNLEEGNSIPLDGIDTSFKKTDTIEIPGISGVDNFESLTFTGGELEVVVPDNVELKNITVELEGKSLGKKEKNTFSFDGLQINKDDFNIDDEIEIKVGFEVVEYTYDGNLEFNIQLKETAEFDWFVNIKEYELEVGDNGDNIFDVGIKGLEGIDTENIVFEEDSRLIFEIENLSTENDFLFNINVGDGEVNLNQNNLQGEIDFKGETLAGFSDKKITFSGEIPKGLTDVQIGIDYEDLSWSIEPESFISILNREISDGDKLLSKELDLSGLDVDKIREYLSLTVDSLDFLINLESSIDNLAFELDGFKIGNHTINDFEIAAGEEIKLSDESIEEVLSIIFPDDGDTIEKLSVEIGKLKTVDNAEPFIISQGKNTIKADAAFDFIPVFELKPDEGTEAFTYKADPVEMELDSDTREALKNNINSVEVVQEVVNQLPLDGKVRLFIGNNDIGSIVDGSEITKEDFYDPNHSNTIYNSDLLDLEEDDERYIYQKGLGEGFINSLLEEGPLYVGFMLEIPMDENDESREISFSKDDRIELKMWSNVTVRVNSQN